MQLITFWGWPMFIIYNYLGVFESRVEIRNFFSESQVFQDNPLANHHLRSLMGSFQPHPNISTSDFQFSWFKLTSGWTTEIHIFWQHQLNHASRNIFFCLMRSSCQWIGLRLREHQNRKPWIFRRNIGFHQSIDVLFVKSFEAPQVSWNFWGHDFWVPLLSQICDSVRDKCGAENRWKGLGLCQKI